MKIKELAINVFFGILSVLAMAYLAWDWTNLFYPDLYQHVFGVTK